MAAEKGNKYAEGNEGGRPKAIESPEKMREYFEAYVEKVKSQPKERIVKGNKDFVVSQEKLERPLTMEGFEVYCFENGIINDLGDYFSNRDDRYKEFTTICSIIRKIIRQDQIEGGMCGIYNPSITQRLNGLADKKEMDHKVNLNIPNIPDIASRK